MALSPKASGKLIAELAEDVHIKEDGIKKLADDITRLIENGELSINKFSQNALHPNAEKPWAVDWLFVVDTLNFCFWSLETEAGWTVNNYTGYFALCAAINRAIEDGIEIWNPKFYATVTEEELLKIFRSDNNVQIPLFKERLECLHQVGKVLLKKFDGSFVNCVKQTDKSAVKLLELVISNFDCFRDEAVYKGHKVAIYKRAQILIGDIWACFKNQGIGYFKDIDEITMFADYRIPQTFLYYGAFKYSDRLNEKLKENKYLKNGEEVEVEIRGCSIEAVEQVKKFVQEKIKSEFLTSANAIIIDHYLWDFRREHAQEILDMKLPFHKTYSVYY